ncbi:Dihydrodipicolinate synthase, partial [Salmonella enterica subsp. enterica serovar Anatum str. USDA 100]
NALCRGRAEVVDIDAARMVSDSAEQEIASVVEQACALLSQHRHTILRTSRRAEDRQLIDALCEKSAMSRSAIWASDFEPGGFFGVSFHVFLNIFFLFFESRRRIFFGGSFVFFFFVPVGRILFFRFFYRPFSSGRRFFLVVFLKVFFYRLFFF